jgi:hypothetical protein
MARSCYSDLGRPRQIPALFAWGAKDQLAHADVARDLAERMSDANLAVDAGHNPHIDQPDAVATAINRFPRQPASQKRGTARARSAPGKIVIHVAPGSAANARLWPGGPVCVAARA